MVNITFNENAADEKTLLLNEIVTLLFEKKLARSYERSVIQLLLVLGKNKKGGLNSFKFKEKTHSTMKKIYIFAFIRCTFTFFNSKNRLDS